MKKYISLIISCVIFFVFFFLPSSTFAQQEYFSNTCINEFGEPIDPPPGQLGCSNTTGGTGGTSGGLTDVLSWAEQIATHLEPAFWDYRNRMMGDVSNGTYSANKRTGSSDAVNQLTLDGLYWCTFIVIDSYNLAGRSGLTPAGHLAVVNMIQYWKNTPGYRYLDYDHEDHKTIIQQLKPGYPYFLVRSAALEHTGNEHVGLIRNISLDQNGNGYIETLESNASNISRKYPVDAWSVPEGIPHHTLRGFGAVDE